MFCEFFGKCGGCAYLDISYGEELAMKKNFLEEIFDDWTNISLHPAPAKEAYRNKMEFAFGDEGKDGALALGIRKKRSFYEVASPKNCVLINEDFKKIVERTVEFFKESGETFFHRKRHVGALRHLVLRRGERTGEILVILSASSALQASLDSFVENLLAIPLDGRIVGILHSVNDGVADAVKNENIKILHGRDYYNEEICGLKFKVSAFSFFQTNTNAAEILYQRVSEFAGSGETALDLYCGTGTIAQIISPLFKKVIGVELVEDAIFAAKGNASANGITNCEFHAGDAFAVLESLDIPPLDVIIADPPRDGLHPKSLAKIAALSARHIIYVACKPKSLARDIPTLTEAGYTPVRVEAVDMFPRTPHVEAVMLLQRENS